MELLEIIKWLIEECHKHNGSYQHVTPKDRLAYAEQMLALLREAFDAARPSN